MKLGGEFEECELNGSRSVAKATQLFLGAAKIVYPEPFEELQIITKQLRKKAEEVEKIHTWPTSACIIGSYIFPIIHEWTQKYYLQALFLTIGNTVDAWAKNPKIEGKKIIHPSIHVGAIPPDPPPAYNPSKETWVEYSKKIQKYRTEAEKQWIGSAEAAGWRVARTPSIRNRSGDPLLHFKWLALYQMKGYTYKMIAQLYTDEEPTGKRTIGDDTVKKAVQKTARLIYLPLRK